MKIATIGTGFIVDNFISAARQVEGVQISAVYSRDKQKANAFAKKNGVEKHYSDMDKMLADHEINFVYVASPNSLHFQQTKDALLSGKNVICEKPFTSTEAECQELIDIAKKTNLFLFEAITVQHLPNFIELKKQVGKIGPVKIAQLNFSQYSSRYDALLNNENPNVFSLKYSGGALMDINYYNLYFLVLLFGEPESYEYIANKADNGIDTSGVLLLKYKDFVCVAVGAKDSKSKNMAQIQGENGFIYVPEASSLCVSFTIHTKDGEKEYNLQENENSMFYELCKFYEIFKKSDLPLSHELLQNSSSVMKIVEKARKDAGIVFAADKMS